MPDTISWLLSALEKTEPKERYSVDRLTDAVALFVEAAPIDLLPDLLAGLAGLLDQPPFVERGYCEVSGKFTWLMKGAALAVERLIRARNPLALHKDSLGILYKFRAASQWKDDVKDIKVEFCQARTGMGRTQQSVALVRCAYVARWHQQEAWSPYQLLASICLRRVLEVRYVGFRIRFRRNRNAPRSRRQAGCPLPRIQNLRGQWTKSR